MVRTLSAADVSRYFGLNLPLKTREDLWKFAEALQTDTEMTPALAEAIVMIARYEKSERPDGFYSSLFNAVMAVLFHPKISLQVQVTKPRKLSHAGDRGIYMTREKKYRNPHYRMILDDYRGVNELLKHIIDEFVPCNQSDEERRERIRLCRRRFRDWFRRRRFEFRRNTHLGERTNNGHIIYSFFGDNTGIVEDGETEDNIKSFWHSPLNPFTNGDSSGLILFRDGGEAWFVAK